MAGNALQMRLSSHHPSEVDHPDRIKPGRFLRISPRITHHACAIHVVIKRRMRMSVQPQLCLAHQVVHRHDEAGVGGVACEGRGDGARVRREMGDDDGVTVEGFIQLSRQPVFVFDTQCDAVLGRKGAPAHANEPVVGVELAALLDHARALRRRCKGEVGPECATEKTGSGDDALVAIEQADPAVACGACQRALDGGELTLDRPHDPAAVLRAFSQANIVSLQHLQAEAEVLPLKPAIAMLRSAQLVHVIGLRRSYSIAAYLAYALNRIGRSAIHITAQGGMVAEQASALGAQDVLVAISFPPYAADTPKVCEQAKAKGAKVLAITNGVLSPLGGVADLLIEVNDAELKGFRSLTSALCVVQTLVMGIAFGQRHRSRKGAGTQPGPDLFDIDC